MSMGGVDYIFHLEVFVKSLVSFGIRERNICIVCLDQDCSLHFQSAHPQLTIHEYTHRQNSTCSSHTKVSELRCRVSVSKLKFILHYLSRGDAVFFVDADVFFFQHPYEYMRVENTALDFYVQLNRWHGNYNFGVFLAYPGDLTTVMFNYILIEFLQSGRWDQMLFNQWLLKELPKIQSTMMMNSTGGICPNGPNFEVLDPEKYVNMMISYKTPFNDFSETSSSITLAHATCVEGSGTKLFSVLTLYGSSSKKHYTELKTVSLDFEIDQLLATSSDSNKRIIIDLIMQGLVHVANLTNRAIRLPVSYKERLDDPFQPYAIDSADYVESLGVKLVESEYWRRASNRYNRTSTIASNIAFNLENLIGVFDNKSLDGFDEISFSVPPQSWENLNASIYRKLPGDLDGSRWKRSFLCQSFPRKPVMRDGSMTEYCLKMCDMSHF